MLKMNFLDSDFLMFLEEKLIRKTIFQKKTKTRAKQISKKNETKQ